MYYLFGSSFLWVILFLVWMIYLTIKINRVYDRLDKLAKEGGIRAQSQVPAAPAVAPSLPSIAASFTVAPPAPTYAASAPAAPAPSSKIKVDGEEAGGRWLGKIGVLAIVLGVSFFLKWAFDNNLIGPMGRIALGIIGGIALVGVGQFLRKKYLVYSDIVSGGGIAILYLTVFAAFAFYHFIGAGAAMVLMLFVTALSVTLSVLGGTQNLAALGVFGGLLTPLLIRTGDNNLFSLMSYLTVLDLGVLGVALFKKWNKLNVLGFIGTAFLFAEWYGRFYTETQLSTTFFFLTVFFVIYLAAGIIHNILWGKESAASELILVTFAPAAYGFMSYLLLDSKYHAIMGFFMLILALFYFAVSYVAYRMNPKDKQLNLYLPGIGVIFLTVAMPLQFSGHWITLAWLLEAALLVLAGSLTRRHSMNIFAIIVYAVGLVRYFSFDAGIRDLLQHTPLFNSRVFLALVAIAVAYLIGYFFVRHQNEEDAEGRKQAAVLFFVLANLLSLYILTAEITASYEQKILTGQQRASLVSNDFYNRTERSERQQAEFDQAQRSNYEQGRSLRNRRNTVISIAWALYAAVLTAIGFGAKRRLLRILGLILFFVTAFKVLADVWALGQLYRIISSITFGVIALLVSFAYAKWKHRLKEVL